VKLYGFCLRLRDPVAHVHGRFSSLQSKNQWQAVEDLEELVFRHRVQGSAVEGHCSESFRMEWGVWQGSVLSPMLFLVMMNHLLRQLEESGMGLSVNSFYAGGFLHADDIRTLAINVSSMEELVAMVRILQDRTS